VEAVRQAQAAQDWGMAARLLSDHWLDLYLAGRGATLVELLARFPRRVVVANPELAAVQAAGDLVRGALDDARWHLAMAAGALAAVPADRRGLVQVKLAVLRPLLEREKSTRIVPPRLNEPLTNSETRVLRYLPTHLTAPDIANELCLSVNTVNTHMRHVYAKLGAHSRQEAVNHARALGLLAPAR
jgi:ATP/maltotriose-dependent transcriptional regulator MalT